MSASLGHVGSDGWDGASARGEAVNSEGSGRRFLRFRRLRGWVQAASGIGGSTPATAAGDGMAADLRTAAVVDGGGSGPAQAGSRRVRKPAAPPSLGGPVAVRAQALPGSSTSTRSPRSVAVLCLLRMPGATGGGTATSGDADSATRRAGELLAVFRLRSSRSRGAGADPARTVQAREITAALCFESRSVVPSPRAKAPGTCGTTRRVPLDLWDSLGLVGLTWSAPSLGGRHAAVSECRCSAAHPG